jgi:hypothetical protein
MRVVTKALGAALSAGLTLGITVPADANGSAHRHHRQAVVHVQARTQASVYPYAYSYLADYGYYVPTRVFRCYPARQMVEDQVGLVVGYVPLGTCG